MATQKTIRERGYTFMQDSYDKITQLHYNSREEKRREEKGVFVSSNEGDEGFI